MKTGIENMGQAQHELETALAHLGKANYSIDTVRALNGDVTAWDTLSTAILLAITKTELAIAAIPAATTAVYVPE